MLVFHSLVYIMASAIRLALVGRSFNRDSKFQANFRKIRSDSIRVITKLLQHNRKASSRKMLSDTTACRWIIECHRWYAMECMPRIVERSAEG